ncbi:MAG TPA: energy-coupling factor transporter transmembrane protein EcfT [Acidimicrobiales bacterium]|nr:energy-coupling factor transporter transmembrane protein EcfT [Acidimicrobiales bacterium]
MTAPADPSPGASPDPSRRFSRLEGVEPVQVDEGRARRRRRPTMVLLRRIEADTPVHRLWAGTKLIAAVAISVVISFFPTWPAVAVLAGLVVGTCVLARVPWSAVPRPPVWFWIALVVGAALTLASGGKPEIAVPGGHVGLGNLEAYCRLMLVGFLLVGSGLLIGWTTSLADVGPAVGRLLGPLRRLRVPADEWAVAIALCIRSLPLFVDEIRTLLAARRLRPPDTSRRGPLRFLDEAVDLLIAGLAVSLRRAAEMGEAMTARGGTGSITDRAPGPGLVDAVALLVVAGACSAGALIPG